ncbi:hypothetical protein T08_3216 [Trichinella sp. T8]|nr:hypothetical protein T08_3216 [Trichinella sp. T8]
MEKLSKKAEKGIYGKIRGLVMTNCNQRPLRPAQIHTLCRCFRGSLLLYKQKANREDWPMKCHLDEQFLELPSNSDIHLWLSIVIASQIVAKGSRGMVKGGTGRMVWLREATRRQRTLQSNKDDHLEGVVCTQSENCSCGLASSRSELSANPTITVYCLSIKLRYVCNSFN